jgi:signal transduction histidine kinase
VTRVLRFGALFAGAVALGLFAEWAALRRGPLEEAASASDIRLAAADFVVGLVLVACGLLAWDRRPESWTGPLLVIAGFTWFLGTFAASGWPGYAAFGSAFLTLHRGPLVQALLAYPSGRPQGWLERGAIALTYVLSAIADVGVTPEATVFVACLVVAVAAYRHVHSTGPERRARLTAMAAAAAFSTVLLISGISRFADSGTSVDRGVLWAYLVVLGAIAVVLTLDLVLRRWTMATVTGLVVDLGELGETAPLRDRLALALGDPSLQVGYRVREREAYVDERGIELELPDLASEREVTVIRQGDELMAVLIHDADALSDPDLLESVSAAARIAVANVRLQAEIRRRLAELEASRRRIVEAGDAQRRRLARELRDGAELHLAEVAALFDEVGAEADQGAPLAAMLAETRAELERARTELEEFGRGIHPRLLTERGLGPALADLAVRARVPVDLAVADGRVSPPFEAAAYFVCSEALANIGKYAEASRVAVAVDRRDEELVVSVRDAGRGGASLDKGSGLRGLADRVEALGGSLRLESPPGKGTLLVAQLPLS